MIIFENFGLKMSKKTFERQGDIVFKVKPKDIKLSRKSILI
jgi:hypothetical protein